MKTRILTIDILLLTLKLRTNKLIEELFIIMKDM